MNLQQTSYLIEESFRTLGRHKGVMFLSVVIMSLTLLVLAVFILATDNMFLLLGKTQSELKVYVYLEDEATAARIEERYRELLAMPEVQSIVFVSKEEALHSFQEELGDDAFVLETIETNPLPASFHVELKPAFRDQAGIEGFAKKAAAMAGVEDVVYGKDFLDRFSFLTRVFLYVDVVLGFIVFLSSIFIISNTVRLTIFGRQKTIEILKLVGATNRFITTPFIIEGAFQGAVAAAVSLGLLAIVYSVVRRMLPDVAFLPADKVVLYVLTCILIGAAGSYTALRRFLKI